MLISALFRQKLQNKISQKLFMVERWLTTRWEDKIKLHSKNHIWLTQTPRILLTAALLWPEIRKLRHVTSRDTPVSDTSQSFRKWSIYWYYVYGKIWSGLHNWNKSYGQLCFAGFTYTLFFYLEWHKFFWASTFLKILILEPKKILKLFLINPYYPCIWDHKRTLV